MRKKIKAKLEAYLYEAQGNVLNYAQSKIFPERLRDAEVNVRVFTKAIEIGNKKIEEYEKTMEEAFGKTKIVKEWEENTPQA